MPIQQSQSKLVLSHPKGSTTEILFFGATVLSWKAPDKSGPISERLFVSSKAVLDGTKAVRGGIPVVFPCFGPPSHPDHAKLAQHGFARNEIWHLDKILMDNEAGVSVRLVLDSSTNDHIRSIYSKPCKLSYVVTLAEHQLSTDLHVHNTSDSDSLEFQALLHTYVLAPADDAQISPLQSLSYYDKTETTEEARATPKTESRLAVDVKQFTDSVYENAPLYYGVRWPAGGLDIRAANFKDVVIWNPQEEGRKIGDMEADGWKRFVCVEPGYVTGFNSIKPGETWIGQQVLTTLQ